MNKSKIIAPESRLIAANASSEASPEVPPLQNDVDEFVTLVMSGIESWVSAGHLLVAMLRRDKNIFNKIIAKCEWITVDVLMTFTRIGRQELRPEVLLPNQSTGNRLMQLGYSQQSKLLDGRVPVVVDMKADNTPMVQEKRITELTQNDLKQVIFGSKVRTVSEQANALRKKARKSVSVVVAPVVKAAFQKEPERKLMFLGCYRIVMRGGVPQFAKAATIPLNAQRILLSDNMGDMAAFIELTQWSK